MSMLSKATGIHIKVPSKQIISGFLGGGPAGALAGAVVGAFNKPKGGVAQAKFSGYPGFDFKNPMRGIPGFGKALGYASGGGRIQPGENGACPKGWHLNKSKLADGTEPGSVCVRNRSMNPANGRAIGRAIRRITSGERQYKRVYTILHKHSGGKVMPKRRKH